MVYILVRIVNYVIYLCIYLLWLPPAPSILGVTDKATIWRCHSAPFCARLQIIHTTKRLDRRQSFGVLYACVRGIPSEDRDLYQLVALASCQSNLRENCVYIVSGCSVYSAGGQRN